MTLGLRKLIVVAVIVEVLLLANAFGLVRLLAAVGLVDLARYVCSEYLTGTALAVITVQLFLLVSPARVWPTRRCRVCDHLLLQEGRYCSECGSRV